MSRSQKAWMIVLVVAIILVSITIRLSRRDRDYDSYVPHYQYGAQSRSKLGLYPIVGTALLVSSLVLAIRGTFRGNLFLCIMLGHFLFTGSTDTSGQYWHSKPFIITLGYILGFLCICGLTLVLFRARRKEFDELHGKKFPDAILGVYLLITSLAVLLPWPTEMLWDACRDIMRMVRAGGQIRMGLSLWGLKVTASEGISHASIFIGLSIIPALFLAASGIMVFVKRQWGYLLYGAAFTALLVSTLGFLLPHPSPAITVLQLVLFLAGLFFMILLFVRFGPRKASVPDDPRLTGQDRYLSGAALQWRHIHGTPGRLGP